MGIAGRAVHVTVTCEHCSTLNELTITDVVDEQPVRCSSCHSVLGTLGQVREKYFERPPGLAGSSVEGKAL